MDIDGRKHNPEDLRRIKLVRVLDNDFSSLFFDGFKEGVELLLKVILNKDVKVIDSRTQKELKNIEGRSVCFDIYAIDDSGNKHDVEIQRDDRGANPKRARYHSSVVDADMLRAGEDFTDIHENFVIFITENDVIGMNLPIYHIDSVIRETKMKFDDGRHIIYVNGAIRTKETALGRLMHDFFCTEAKDMYYKVLSERVKQFKETEKGVAKMCEIWDEVRNEKACEIAKAMIKDGKLTYEDIASYSGLSIDKVRELAGNKSA